MKRGRKGFVLVEVAIAMGIFAICITAVLCGIARGLDVVKKQRDLTMAQNIVRIMMEKLENVPFPRTTSARYYADLATTVRTIYGTDYDYYIWFPSSIPSGYPSATPDNNYYSIVETAVNIYRVSEADNDPLLVSKKYFSNWRY